MKKDNSLFKNPRANYLTITDEALLKIKELIKKRSSSCDGIKIIVRTRGCSGLSYKIEYALKDKNISKYDDLLQKDGINIFIDSKISMFLIGSKMIYTQNELESGFDFVNPNESGRCGCGSSFHLKSNNA